MYANILILIAIVAFFLYLRSVRPKQLESGDWQVADHSDGTLRSVFAFFALLIGTQWALGVGKAFLEILPKNPGGSLLGILVVAALYGWLLWVQGRKVFEALHADRGEINVADWPLAAGEHLELTYRRRFHRGMPAGDIKAALVHYEVAHGHFGGRHGSKFKNVVKKVQLEDGEASFKSKELVATWRFQVPNPMGNPIASLQRGMIDYFFNRHRDDEWWELQIEVPLRSVGTLDSQFKLDITFVPGRTQFHMGA